MHGACLRGHCQPWALSNFGLGLGLVRRRSAARLLVQPRSWASTRKSRPEDRRLLYECKGYLLQMVFSI